MKVIIVNKQGPLTAKIQERLSANKAVNVEIIGSPDAASKLIGETGAGVFMVGPSIPFETAIKLADRATEAGPGLIMVLIAEELSAGSLRQAVRAGFRDIVDADNLDEIYESVERAVRLGIAKDPGDLAGDGEHTGRTATVVTLFSTKGGVGKTVFSVNTAVGLAKQGKNVALLDFDHHFGDVGVMLGLKPDRTILDLIPSIDRLDADMLAGYYITHESGLKVLLAPVRQDIAEPMAAQDVQKVFSVARTSTDYLLIDTPSFFAEHALTVLDNSDCICLVTTLDVPSLKNTQIALQNLNLLGYDEDKIRLLLNRADSKVSLSPAEVERHLKHKIAVQVPSDRAVPRSVNEGIPLLMENRRSPVTQALNQIVELVAGVREAGAQPGEEEDVDQSELRTRRP